MRKLSGQQMKGLKSQGGVITNQKIRIQDGEVVWGWGWRRQAREEATERGPNMRATGPFSQNPGPRDP